MSHLSIHGVLLAQRSRLEGLSQGFRGNKVQIDFGDVVLGLVILAVVVGAIWILSKLLGQSERGRPCNRPGRLFLTLCKAHGLRWSQWWLLRAIRVNRASAPLRWGGKASVRKRIAKTSSTVRSFSRLVASPGYRKMSQPRCASTMCAASSCLSISFPAISSIPG